jgi:DNA-binding transcriptional ArsR family regulator
MFIASDTAVLYNIFVQMNISKLQNPLEDTCNLLSLIGQPARIQILLVIGTEEVCVCHMEAVLDMRQASISQHLMILRRAGLVSARRDGRNIYYRLVFPEVLDLIRHAAQLLGLDTNSFWELAALRSEHCPCSLCSTGAGVCK